MVGGKFYESLRGRYKVIARIALSYRQILKSSLFSSMHVIVMFEFERKFIIKSTGINYVYQITIHCYSHISNVTDYDICGKICVCPTG